MDCLFRGEVGPVPSPKGEGRGFAARAVGRGAEPPSEGNYVRLKDQYREEK
jgi:hypothetical protein